MTFLYDALAVGAIFTAYYLFLGIPIALVVALLNIGKKDKK